MEIYKEVKPISYSCHSNQDNEMEIKNEAIDTVEVKIEPEDVTYKETEEMENYMYNFSKVEYVGIKEENDHHLQETEVLVEGTNDQILHSAEGIECVQTNSVETKHKEKCKDLQKRKVRRRHKLLHPEDLLYSCEVCGKSYTRKDQLNSHKRLHTGERFPCSECGKSFVHERSLNAHMRYHTGQGFPCQICGKCFSRRSKLTAHMSIHTGKHFSCEVCGKYFSQSGSLNRHMHLHTDIRFSCHICGKSFSQKGYLPIHMDIHEGQRFSCGLCGRIFNVKANLNKHMQIHNAANFSCELCGKSFKQEKRFKVHNCVQI